MITRHILTDKRGKRTEVWSFDTQYFTYKGKEYQLVGHVVKGGIHTVKDLETGATKEVVHEILIEKILKERANGTN